MNGRAFSSAQKVGGAARSLFPVDKRSGLQCFLKKKLINKKKKKKITIIIIITIIIF